MDIVIGKSANGRVVAMEFCTQDDDWPTSAREVVNRWLAQGVIANERQAEFWKEQAGYFLDRESLPGR